MSEYMRWQFNFLKLITCVLYMFNDKFIYFIIQLVILCKSRTVQIYKTMEYSQQKNLNLDICIVHIAKYQLLQYLFCSTLLLEYKIEKEKMSWNILLYAICHIYNLLRIYNVPEWKMKCWVPCRLEIFLLI